MIRNVTVGIDVGTQTTRVVVAEYLKGEAMPRVIATGLSPTAGLRHGYIVNMDDAVKSIRKAAAEAEKNSGIKIKRAFLSVGGISLGAVTGSGSAVISKADSEVTTLDVSKAIGASEDALQFPNKRIIHVIPVEFKLDSKEIHGRPEGRHGIKLEVKTLFVTCLEQHLDDLVTAVSEADIEVIDVIASPIAASLVALTDRQKTAGCVLVDIGAETVSLAVFENGTVISLHVFSIGSTDITNDIALGLKIPLDEAERVKHGALTVEAPKRRLESIIEARLSDIFELVDKHLKSIKRSGLLPAGIIILGGGSELPSVNIEAIAKNLLKLPARTAMSDIPPQLKNKLRDSSWLGVYGLAVAGKDSPQGVDYSSGRKVLQGIRNFFVNISRQLLP